MAEIAAGAIAMGLGGYLAARTDQEHYEAEERREYDEVKHLPARELAEIKEIFEGYGMTGKALQEVVKAVSADKKRWVNFMMRFELGLEKPDPKRAPASAATIAGSYLVGGIIPLLPYILLEQVRDALRYSVIFTGVALLVFGAVKGRMTGISLVKSSLQTLLVGGLAAGAAFYLASLFAE